jgi:hypothetical protein
LKIAEAGLALIAAGAVVIAGAGLGCAPRNDSPPPAADRADCRRSGSDPAGVASLEGEFLLQMSAVEGPRAETAAEGTLTLIRRDSASVPFYGWTSIDVESIGAHRLGDPASRDPSAPGVLVLTGPATEGATGAPAIVLRLGSQANRADIIRFDGAFTALYVRWIEEDGFGGDWASGVRGPEATGDFCAMRVSPPR